MDKQQKKSKQELNQLMMATKPTTSLRDRRISPSPSLLHHSSSASRPARPSLKTSLSGGDNTSPPEAKKPAPNHLKPKSVPSSESPVRRIPTITASATSKTPSARRLADNVPSPSTPALQRSLKPATPTPKLSSSSMLNGYKSAQTVSRTVRSTLVPKTKSTSPTLVKKKEAHVTIAETAFERPVQEQSWNNHKKVFEALNEMKNVEESKFISSMIEEENHIEEQKSGEPENWVEVLVPQVFDEVSKEPVVLEEVPKQVVVAVASAQMEKKDEGKKVEHVDPVVRIVDPEVRKLRLGAAVVTAMPTAKKDAPISNDVIEETKSKLMERRKNKVLALVGAFETVISLQEPEGQVIHKALQVQHGQQIQQVEQSFENQNNQLSVETQQNQEVREAQNAQQLEEGDEVHQDQQKQVNGEHQDKEKEEENAMLKEEGNDALERGDEMLKEEEDDEAL